MVELSSWQAQLSGTKVWTLTPPPECEHVCQAFNITVNKGDISERFSCGYTRTYCTVIITIARAPAQIAKNLLSQLLTVTSACSCSH